MAGINQKLAINWGRLERFKTNQDAANAATYRKKADKVPYADIADPPTIPTVPTVVSAFTNDADYATKAEAAELAGLKPEIVDELPEASEANERTLYLLRVENGEDDDLFDEYLLADGKFEKIGSTRLDLTGYLTEADFATDADIDAMFETPGGEEE